MAQNWEDWAAGRIRFLERRLIDVDGTAARRIRVKDDAITRLFDLVGQLKQRVNDLESVQTSTVMRLTAYGVPEYGKIGPVFVPRLKDDMPPTGGIGCFPPVDEEFSPPVGQDSEAERPYVQGGAPWHDEMKTQVDWLREKGNRNAEMFERGKAAGAQEAIDEAVERLRVVLGQMGWHASSPAVKTVLDPVRGEGSSN